MIRVRESVTRVRPSVCSAKAERSLRFVGRLRPPPLVAWRSQLRYEEPGRDEISCARETAATWGNDLRRSYIATSLRAPRPTTSSHLTLLTPCTASKRLINPPRINRDFTDSEDDHRGYTSSHSSPRRSTRSARVGASGHAQGDKRHGDEVDELDDEEEDEVDEEEDVASSDNAARLPVPPAASSIRYTSNVINGHQAQPNDTTRRLASSPGSTSPAGHRVPLSRSTTADPLARSQSRDRALGGKRVSDGFRHPIAGGPGDRYDGQSPFAGKSKRKGAADVTEGEVEGEVSPDVAPRSGSC